MNYKMLGSGGFEGNGQTFRIVGRLEAYHAEHGMDLTRRTLLGLRQISGAHARALRPPAEARPSSLAQWKPAKSHYHADADLLDWVLAPLSDDDSPTIPGR